MSMDPLDGLVKSSEMAKVDQRPWQRHAQEGSHDSGACDLSRT